MLGFDHLWPVLGRRGRNISMPREELLFHETDLSARSSCRYLFFGTRHSGTEGQVLDVALRFDSDFASDVCSFRTLWRYNLFNVIYCRV